MNRRSTVLFLTVLSLAMLIVPLSSHITASGHQLVTFRSYDEVRTFLQSKSVACSRSYLQGGALRAGPSNLLSLSSNTAQPSSSPSHSETNNQVAGVDEPDTVKTDGRYVYTVTNNSLAILEAYPPTNARVVASVAVNGTILGVLVYNDRLAIIGESGRTWGGFEYSRASVPLYWPQDGNATVWVYDIAERSNPVLKRTVTVAGDFVSSRLIGDFVYLVASRQAYACGGPVYFPTRTINGNLARLGPQQIYHSDIADYSHSFTSVVGLNIGNDSKEPTVESFLLGTSGTVYVSLRDIYLTSPIADRDGGTAIHRISIDQGTIRYEATGEVPGHILNQFSMDENGEYFRVATTAWRQSPLAILSSTTSPRAGPLSGLTTSLYVLNRELHIVGRLEGLGENEQFHSARFVGNRAYLVTFKKVDPLFVIDLSQPRRPRVLGELHVTGYSDYLQPYDETHLIGIGKETEDAGSFAWYQGVKVSLFDVSNPADPVETAKYVIGGRGSNSPALSEHKAVLFDRDRNLLVIPVEVAMRPENVTVPAWQWGTIVWQGAYVFRVSPEKGLVFRGGITHFSDGELPNYNTQKYVSRSLYIGEVLYTLSSSKVKMNSLADLSELGVVSL